MTKAFTKEFRGSLLQKAFFLFSILLSGIMVALNEMHLLSRNYSSVAPALCGILISLLFFLIRQCTLTLNETGIKVLSIHSFFRVKPTFINWNQIKNITVLPKKDGITIDSILLNSTSPTGSLKISILAWENRAELVELIKQHIPEECRVKSRIDDYSAAFNWNAANHPLRVLKIASASLVAGIILVFIIVKLLVFFKAA